MLQYIVKYLKPAIVGLRFIHKHQINLAIVLILLQELIDINMISVSIWTIIQTT